MCFAENAHLSYYRERALNRGIPSLCSTFRRAAIFGAQRAPRIAAII
jgi:hypothetical protein